MNFEVLGGILRESRIKAGFTQDAIAAHLNLTPQNTNTVA